MTTKKQPGFKIDAPQAVLASVAIAALAAVYVLAPDSRDEIERGVLAVWAVAASFLRPMIARREEASK